MIVFHFTFTQNINVNESIGYSVQIKVNCRRDITGCGKKLQHKD